MNQSDIAQLVLSWGNGHFRQGLKEEQLALDVSLLGMNSIDVVELCEYLEEKIDIEVDPDLVMDLESLNDLCIELAKQLAE